jgi:hypothetical protein
MTDEKYCLSNETNVSLPGSMMVTALDSINGTEESLGRKLKE